MRLRQKLLFIIAIATLATILTAAVVIPEQTAEFTWESTFVAFAMSAIVIHAITYFLLDRLLIHRVNKLSAQLQQTVALSPANPDATATSSAKPNPNPADELDEIHQQVTALAKTAKQNRIQLSLLLQVIPVVVMALDEKGVFIQVEGSGLALADLDPNQVRGQSIFDLYAKNVAITDGVQQALAGQPVKSTVVLNDQTWDAWYRPAHVEDAGYKGAFIIAINATERAQVESDLNKAKEAAEAASYTKTTFLANMSHELRTPLNAIIGFIGVMQMNKKLDEKDTHRLERVLVNGHRLLELIDDILDLSRLEAGRMVFAPSDIEVRESMRNLLKRMEERAENKKLAFTSEITTHVPAVIHFDEDAIHKISTHLLTNAVKFTPAGEVHFTMDYKKDHLIIKVKDTGIGIPAHMHDVIFQSFRQADDSSTREYGGTGLGLAIVHQLCLALGGTVALDSKVNEGSTFTVKLPLVTSDVRAAL